MSYQRLADETERPPKTVRDWTARWDEMLPLASVNGTTRERVESFAGRKHFSLQALEALGARIAHNKRGGVYLAFAGRNGTGTVTAIKYRPLDGSSHDSIAEKPSVWLRPIIVGKLDSLDWFVAEGETDAARLVGLVGDVAAVLCLPAGAKTFRREWADTIPRGATVHLCHDADSDGDEGAEKAAKIIGGRNVRLRPPDGFEDWCEWEGERDEFIALTSAAREEGRTFEFVSLDEFLAHPFPKAEPLLGEPGSVLLAVGSLLLVYGAEGSGKSTWTVDGIAHLAAGHDWLDVQVPRPVRFAIIENEGPPALFQDKLAAKLASWDGPPWKHNVFTFQHPWGEFTFASPAARRTLTTFCEDNEIDVVVANPTLGLGVAGSGRPDETQAFVDWMTECGLKSTLAFWLLHHENKAGQISGDWGRHPDTKVQLQADGNQPRTKLTWEKTRWATLPTPDRPKACVLEWIIETQSYNVVEIDAVGASDSELQARVDDFLTEHPWSSTTTVEKEVKGSATRIRKLLDSGRYDRVDGKRGAKLWHFQPTPSASDNDGETGEGGNPHH